MRKSNRGEGLRPLKGNGLLGACLAGKWRGHDLLVCLVGGNLKAPNGAFILRVAPPQINSKDLLSG